MSAVSPHQFAARWQNTPLRERQSYQIHFTEVCDLVGHQRPSGTGVDEQGRVFGFEYGVKKDGGAQGFADVFYEGHFAIEYKGAGKYKDLSEAYQQLLQYREKLKNPPLLVVTDIDTWEIHTNWPNTEKKVYRFNNADIANRPSILRMLHDLFHAPERLHPDRNTEQVTTDAAEAFRIIAEDMRHERAADAQRIAHFLTKLVFCLFAEDVNLLPNAPNSSAGIFAEIIDRTRREPSRFRRYAGELFQAMAEGGEVLFQKIPYFDGLLFDDVTVEDLSLEALGRLESASNLNWESVEPAIFGTLFERSLDPSKRAQLGAHYTSREDILLIVEPVLMAPLRREWEAIKAEAAPIRARLDAAATPRDRIAHTNALTALRERMLKRLREIKVLDPACGSGNFLYVALQRLMDLEKEVIHHELFGGLTLPLPEVHPRQMYGIEKDPIAHDLASIVVWIGYIQWRQQNGYATLTRKEPILEPLKDNIRLMDAILTLTPDPSPDGRGEQAAAEPEWPEADVIIGNPPFLGGNKIRGELGDAYVDALFKLYEGRVPAFADLVCYWFEKARAHLEAGKAKRAGLLATNSIRGGANRKVLERIKASGDIFMAWSDREWVLEGAAVRVSMVGFEPHPPTPSPTAREREQKMLDGVPVATINADLTGSVDITKAKSLKENEGLVARGIETGGPFELSDEEAKRLKEDTHNAAILVPIINGNDVTDRPRSIWIVDFAQTPDKKPEDYPEIYNLIQQRWYEEVNDKTRKRPPQMRENWWAFRRSGEKLREIVKLRNRYIATPRVAKHRLFIWVERPTLPDSALFVFAREDDYFFGVLHSRLHEVWALRMGTSLEDRPRYTPTTTFETFPFPWPPGKEDTGSAAYQAISAAAKQLHEERDAWLNPSPGPSPYTERGSKDRTLTNLYNALAVWRTPSPAAASGRGGKRRGKITDAAGDFAPRLAELHAALDAAVCDAYGWPREILTDDEEILRRLLALNLERAG